MSTTEIVLFVLAFLAFYVTGREIERLKDRVNELEETAEHSSDETWEDD